MKLTTNEIIERIKNKMGDSPYSDLINLIAKENTKIALERDCNTNVQNELYFKFVYPKIRQYGSKIQIKTRNVAYQVSDMTMFKYNSSLGQQLQLDIKKENADFDDKEYDEKLDMVIKLGTKLGLLSCALHYSLWMNNQIYHWGNKSTGKWNMYGPDETDREITNIWEASKKYDSIYFTMQTNEDLNKFCVEWEKNNLFKTPEDSERFIDELVNELELLKYNERED